MLRAAMQLVHDELSKISTPLLFVLIFSTSTFSHAREIDLTHWREMDENVYKSLVLSIKPGDRLIYEIDNRVNTFNVVRRLNKSDKTEGYLSALFLLSDRKVLRIPESKMVAETLVNFVDGQKGFARAGVNVVKVYSESHPPDFLIEEYVRYISLRAVLFLLKDNNAGYATYEMGRPIPETERTHIKSEAEKFIRSLAVLSDSYDFGLGQSAYDIDAGIVKVMDFLGEPTHFDPTSDLPQSHLTEAWHSPDFSKANGENVGNRNYISLSMYKFVSGIIEDERLRLKTAQVCEPELNLTPLKPGLPQHPQGPTGT